jgi:hypothetical protein
LSRVITREREKVVGVLPKDITVPLSEGLDFVLGMRARDDFQAADLWSDVVQGNHALHALEVWAGEEILVDVEALCAWVPSLIDPPWPPHQQAVHRHDQAVVFVGSFSSFRVALR